MNVHVYTGPTLGESEALSLLPGAIVHPPVANGDVLAISVGAGDVVVIIDGFYHQRAPVRHKELLYLIDRGVRVVGCASMGALRAAELDVYGMIGHGRVYQMYRSGEIDADDEVAVAHLPGGTFESRNVPMVNVRNAVAQAVRAGALSKSQATSTVAAARHLHYSERSWRDVYAGLAQSGETEVATALCAYLVAHPASSDTKRLDAIDTLKNIEQVLAAAQLPRPLGRWRNPHLYEWLPEFQGGNEKGAPLVSDAEVFRYQQVYRPDFPARWRGFVIREASLGPGITCAPADESGVAREVFAYAGFAGSVLPADNEYLTRDERSRLGDDEARIRTLVRSYVPPRGIHDAVSRMPAPPNIGEIRDVIIAAKALNEEVLWGSRGRLVDRLSPDRLVAHLELLLDVSPGDHETLLARVRDRGLGTVAAAVSAVRPYFLRDDAANAGSAAQKWLTK